MATSLSVLRFDSDGKILEQDIRLDESGDLALVTELKELQERTTCRLQMFRGEDVFDRTSGLPLTQRVLQRPYSEALAASVISSEILQIPEVETVEDVEITVTDRHLSYVATRITSSFGEIKVEVG